MLGNKKGHKYLIKPVTFKGLISSFYAAVISCKNSENFHE